MTYHRGTLEEFIDWHEAAKLAFGIPDSGKIGFCNGQPAPQNQLTTDYAKPIQNPMGGDDYIWTYGLYPDNEKPDLSLNDVIEAGWFGE